MPITAQEMQRRRKQAQISTFATIYGGQKKTTDRHVKQSATAEISPREAAQITSNIVHQILGIEDECEREKSLASLEAERYIFKYDWKLAVEDNNRNWKISAIYLLNKIANGYTFLEGDMKVLQSLIES